MQVGRVRVGYVDADLGEVGALRRGLNENQSLLVFE